MYFSFLKYTSISVITVGIFFNNSFQRVSLSLSHTSGLTLTVSLDSNITLDSYKDFTVPTRQQCMLLGLKDNIGTFGYVRSAQQCHFYQLTKVQMRTRLQPQNGMDVFSVFFEVSTLCNVLFIYFFTLLTICLFFGSFRVCLNSSMQSWFVWWMQIPKIFLFRMTGVAQLFSCLFTQHPDRISLWLEEYIQITDKVGLYWL